MGFICNVCGQQVQLLSSQLGGIVVCGECASTYQLPREASQQVMLLQSGKFDRAYYKALYQEVSSTLQTRVIAYEKELAELRARIRAYEEAAPAETSAVRPGPVTAAIADAIEDLDLEARG